MWRIKSIKGFLNDHKIAICREIYRFQQSSQDKNIQMDCLILLDKAEIPKGLDKSPASIVRVSSTVMKKLARLQSTDSIDAIALMNIPTSFVSLDGNQETADCWRWFSSPHRVLVLDRIQVTIIVPSRFKHLGLGRFLPDFEGIHSSS